MRRILFFSDWTLRWKFLFIFLVLVMVPMLAFSLYVYSQANQAVQLQAINNTKAHLDKIEENVSAVLQDIEDMSSYMIYSEDIRSFLLTPDIPQNRMLLNDMERRINGFSVFHLNSKFYLNSITLVGMHDNRIHIGLPLIESDESVWRQRAIDVEGRVVWSEAYPIKDYWGRESKVFSLHRVINDINNVARPIGMVTIRLDAAKLYELIEIDIRNLEQTFVLDQNGMVVMHPRSAYIGQLYPDSSVLQVISPHMAHEGTVNFKKDSVNYYAVTQPLEGTDLVLISIVNKDMVAKGITGIQDSIRLMMVALTVLGALAMLGFYHFNIKRILDLMKQTQQVERGDFSASVSVTSQDEIGRLGLRFNKMVERLRHLIDNEYKMEIRNRESELKLLQSQINPHFLYNTLDMIRWKARLERATETSKLIEQLSQMFRISLNRGKPWICLKDELIYSQSYLELQKRRLGNKLEYTLYCDHDALQAIMLKQTIQPLIENSIQHGFENMRTLRKIYIRCFRENHQLIVDVIDNGKGFSEENFQSAIQGGYALQNIQDRLSIAFGGEASISVKKMDSPGAWVRVVFPYKVKEESQDFAKSVGEAHEV